LPRVLVLLAAAQSLDIPFADLIKGLVNEAITIAVAALLSLILCVSTAEGEHASDQ
jgi:hypothetical protein